MMWNRRSSVSIQLLEPIIFIGSNLETSPVIRGSVNVSFQRSSIIEKLQLDFKGIMKTECRRQGEKTKQNQQTIAASHLQLYPASEYDGLAPPLLLNTGSTRFSFEMPLPAGIPETISCSQVNVDYNMAVSLYYRKVGATQTHDEKAEKRIILARLPDMGDENYYPAAEAANTIDSHKHFSNWCQYRITIDTKSAVLGSKLPLKIEIAPIKKDLRLKQVFLQLVEKRTIVSALDQSTTTSQSVHFLHPAKGSNTLVLPNRPLTQNWQGSCLYQIPDDNSISHSTQNYSNFFRVSHLLLVSLLVSVPDSSRRGTTTTTTRTISFKTQIDLLDSHVTAELGDREFAKLPSYDCPISIKETEALKRHGLGIMVVGPPTYEESLLAF